MIKLFLYDFFYVGDQLEFAIIDNGIVILIVNGIMASPPALVVIVVHGTPGKPKVFARDLHL